MSTFVRACSGWKLLLAALLSCVVAIAAVPTPDLDQTSEPLGISRYRFKRAERCLMRRINEIRARHGLSRLRADKQLAYVARQHATEMSGNGGVYHDYDVSWKVTRWRRLAQNTGRGRSCRSLARSFMHSSSHRSNILGRFRYMGFGTQKRDGRVFVQQLFESRRDPGNVYHYP